MSTNGLSNKIRELKELKQLEEELRQKIRAIEGAIKFHMRDETV